MNPHSADDSTSFLAQNSINPWSCCPGEFNFFAGQVKCFLEGKAMDFSIFLLKYFKLERVSRLNFIRACL